MLRVASVLLSWPKFRLLSGLGTSLFTFRREQSHVSRSLRPQQRHVQHAVDWCHSCSRQNSKLSGVPSAELGNQFRLEIFGRCNLRAPSLGRPRMTRRLCGAAATRQKLKGRVPVRIALDLSPRDQVLQLSDCHEPATLCVSNLCAQAQPRPRPDGNSVPLRSQNSAMYRTRYL